jgi:hypothetical protein
VFAAESVTAVAYGAVVVEELLAGVVLDLLSEQKVREGEQT